MIPTLQLGQFGRAGARATPGSSFVGPLDAYTANLWAAFSLDRLLTSYSGGAFNAVNTTTSATGTIGFNATTGALDTAALATFSGANSVVASALNNQFGLSSHGFAGSGTQQPAVVSSGTYLGHIEFNGTTNALATGTVSGSPSAFTVFIRGKLRVTTGSPILLEHSTNYNSNNSAIAYYDTGALSVGLHNVSPAGYARSDFSGVFPNDTTHCWRFDRAQASSILQSVCFVNGVKQTRSADGSTGTLPSGTFGASTWFLGARNLSVAPAPLNLHTLLIYEGAVSDADVATISGIIAGLA